MQTTATFRPDQARLNITYAGQNGDFIDPVPLDASDAVIRQWVEEALHSGSIPGIPATPSASLADFVVDRFAPNETRDHALIQIRPKTAFGAHNCCFHAYRGPCHMVLKDGHVLQQCCTCQRMRQVHADHAEDKSLIRERRDPLLQSLLKRNIEQALTSPPVASLKRGEVAAWIRNLPQ